MNKLNENHRPYISGAEAVIDVCWLGADLFMVTQGAPSCQFMLRSINSTISYVVLTRHEQGATHTARGLHEPLVKWGWLATSGRCNQSGHGYS